MTGKAALAFRIYCSLAGSQKEVSEFDLLSDDKLLASLVEAGSHLEADLYSILTEESRRWVRDVVLSLHPFDLSEVDVVGKVDFDEFWSFPTDEDARRFASGLPANVEKGVRDNIVGFRGVLEEPIEQQAIKAGGQISSYLEWHSAINIQPTEADLNFGARLCARYNPHDVRTLPADFPSEHLLSQRENYASFIGAIAPSAPEDPADVIVSELVKIPWESDTLTWALDKLAESNLSEDEVSAYAKDLVRTLPRTLLALPESAFDCLFDGEVADGLEEFIHWAFPNVAEVGDDDDEEEEEPEGEEEPEREEQDDDDEEGEEEDEGVVGEDVFKEFPGMSMDTYNRAVEWAKTEARKNRKPFFVYTLGGSYFADESASSQAVLQTKVDPRGNVTDYHESVEEGMRGSIEIIADDFGGVVEPVGRTAFRVVFPNMDVAEKFRRTVVMEYPTLDFDMTRRGGKVAFSFTGMPSYESVGEVLKKAFSHKTRLGENKNPIPVRKLQKRLEGQTHFHEIITAEQRRKMVVVEYKPRKGKHTPKKRKHGGGNYVYPLSKADPYGRYPLSNAKQARNALARAGACDSQSPWMKARGVSCAELKKKVKSAVKSAYPSIDVSEGAIQRYITEARDWAGDIFNAIRRNRPRLGRWTDRILDLVGEEDFNEAINVLVGAFGMGSLPPDVQKLLDDWETFGESISEAYPEGDTPLELVFPGIKADIATEWANEWQGMGFITTFSVTGEGNGVKISLTTYDPDQIRIAALMLGNYLEPMDGTAGIPSESVGTSLSEIVNIQKNKAIVSVPDFERHNLPPKAQFSKWLMDMGFGDGEIKTTKGTWYFYMPGNKSGQFKKALKQSFRTDARIEGVEDIHEDEFSKGGILRTATSISRKMKGGRPEYIGNWRFSDKNESAMFKVYTPENGQEVYVLVSMFEDNTFTYRLFNSKNTSEMNRLPAAETNWAGSPGMIRGMAEEIGEDLEEIDRIASTWENTKEILQAIADGVFEHLGTPVVIEIDAIGGGICRGFVEPTKALEVFAEALTHLGDGTEALIDKNESVFIVKGLPLWFGEDITEGITLDLQDALREGSLFAPSKVKPSGELTNPANRAASAGKAVASKANGARQGKTPKAVNRANQGDKAGGKTPTTIPTAAHGGPGTSGEAEPSDGYSQAKVGVKGSLFTILGKKKGEKGPQGGGGEPKGPVVKPGVAIKSFEACCPKCSNSVKEEILRRFAPALVEQDPVAPGGAVTTTPAADKPGNVEAPPGAAATPSKTEPEEEPEKPTELEPTKKEPDEEKGGPMGGLACPSCGEEIPRDVLKGMLGDLLAQLATQLQQGAVEKPEEKPEEEPEEEEPEEEEPEEEKPKEPEKEPAAAPAAPAPTPPPPAAAPAAPAPPRESVAEAVQRMDHTSYMLDRGTVGQLQVDLKIRTPKDLVKALQSNGIFPAGAFEPENMRGRWCVVIPDMSLKAFKDFMELQEVPVIEDTRPKPLYHGTLRLTEQGLFEVLDGKISEMGAGFAGDTVVTFRSTKDLHTAIETLDDAMEKMPSYALDDGWYGKAIRFMGGPPVPGAGRKVEEALAILGDTRLKYSVEVLEGVSEERMEPVGTGEPGGQIVFSTDVNITGGRGFLGRVVNWFKTRLNRFLRLGKLGKALGQAGREFGYSIGQMFTGRYVDAEGNTFDEKSLAVEILGVPKQFLIDVGLAIAKEFEQEAVLVRSYEDQKPVFVYAEGIEEVAPGRMTIPEFITAWVEKNYNPKYVAGVVDDLIDTATGNKKGNTFERKTVAELMKEYDNYKRTGDASFVEGVSVFGELGVSLEMEGREIPAGVRVRVLDSYRGNATVDVGGKFLDVKAEDVLVYPDGSTTEECLSALGRGESLGEVALRRLTAKSSAARAAVVQETTVSSKDRYVSMFFPNIAACKQARAVINHLSENIVECNGTSLRVEAKDGLGSRLKTIAERFGGTAAITSRPLAPVPMREQLDIDTDDDDAGQISDLFQGALISIKAARDMLVTAQTGDMARAVALLKSMGAKGKVITSIEGVATAIEDKTAEFKDLLVDLDKAHDVFAKAYPNAKAAAPPAEEPPVEEPAPAPPAEELPPAEEPAPPGEEPPPVPVPAPEPVPTESMNELLGEMRRSRNWNLIRYAVSESDFGTFSNFVRAISGKTKIKEISELFDRLQADGTLDATESAGVEEKQRALVITDGSGRYWNGNNNTLGPIQAATRYASVDDLPLDIKIRPGVELSLEVFDKNKPVDARYYRGSSQDASAWVTLESIESASD